MDRFRFLSSSICHNSLTTKRLSTNRSYHGLNNVKRLPLISHKTPTPHRQFSSSADNSNHPKNFLPPFHPSLDLNYNALRTTQVKPDIQHVNAYLKMQSFWKGGSMTGGAGGTMSPLTPIPAATLPHTASGGFMRNLMSLVLSIVIFVVIINMMGRGAGGPMSDLNGGHKSAKTDEITDRLSDLKGCDDILNELNELIDFLKNPEKYKKLGASIPKGVLLSGPPGTGKTLAARAIAGEAGVSFYWASASDFDEMYVGVGSKRIRSLFKEARENAPSVVFIDEIDAFANRRQQSHSGGSRSTVNTLLVEIDGFNSNENIMVIAATNFADDLDEALTRPGRFDRKLTLSSPDLKGRMELFQHYVKKIKHSNDIDIKRLASSMMGATGADIKTIVNNAAIRAAKENMPAVTHHHIEESKENWAMGVANRTKEYSKESLERTAYHEGGHALMALLTPGGPDIYRATILPRGGALGYVSFTNDQETDSYSVTYKQYLARLDVAMGGRVAEEMIYGSDEITSGASSDLQQATRTARSMVTKFGYSDRNGLMVTSNDMPASDKHNDISDEEVSRLLKESYQRATTLLQQNRDKLERLAQGMLKYETISGAEVRDLIEGRPIVRDTDSYSI